MKVYFAFENRLDIQHGALQELLQARMDTTACVTGFVEWMGSRCSRFECVRFESINASWVGQRFYRVINTKSIEGECTMLTKTIIYLQQIFEGVYWLIASHKQNTSVGLQVNKHKSWSDSVWERIFIWKNRYGLSSVWFSLTSQSAIVPNSIIIKLYHYLLCCSWFVFEIILYQTGFNCLSKQEVGR